MSGFDQVLNSRLEEIRAHGLWRELRRVDSPAGPRIHMNGGEWLNFSSNDYLGLAGHPTLQEAAIEAVKNFGAGAGASRLISGSLSPFHQLEEALADFKGTAAALTFSTGYATALGTITALLGRDDVVIVDKLVHACLVDAARLSGAKLRVFGHNDLSDLEDKLRWAATHPSPDRIPRNTLVVTESVFSMDGDVAPLREIVALKERYGAWLMVDEAHATGLLGPNRRGLVEALGIGERVEIQMGTLGKALGASGGYICGSRALVDLLVNRARSFIFSTAPVPAAGAAALAGLQIVRSPTGGQRLAQLRQRLAEFRTGHAPDVAEGSHTGGTSPAAPTALPIPILPLRIGDEAAAVAAAEQLRAHGIFVPAIRYPTVARGAARLRVTLTATHSPSDVATLLAALPAISRPH